MCRLHSLRFGGGRWAGNETRRETPSSGPRVQVLRVRAEDVGLGIRIESLGLRA